MPTIVDACVLELPDSADAPRAARRVVAEKWQQWGFDGDNLTPSLLTSEVVTNAYKHGNPPRRLRVRRLDRHSVIVEVTDASAVPPTRAVGEPTASGGRGLLLLDSLAERWGYELLATGKRVWFIVCDRFVHRSSEHEEQDEQHSRRHHRERGGGTEQQ